MAEKKMSFEEALSRLEEIVGEMDSGKAELDKLLELFEEGTALVRRCKKDLDNAEKKIKLVTEDGETEFPDRKSVE